MLASRAAADGATYVDVYGPASATTPASCRGRGGSSPSSHCRLRPPSTPMAWGWETWPTCYSLRWAADDPGDGPPRNSCATHSPIMQVMSSKRPTVQTGRHVHIMPIVTRSPDVSGNADEVVSELAQRSVSGDAQGYVSNERRRTPTTRGLSSSLPSRSSSPGAGSAAGDALSELLVELVQAGVVAVVFGLEVRSCPLEKPLGGCCPLVDRVHRGVRIGHLDLLSAQRRFCLGGARRRLASGSLGAGGSVVGSIRPTWAAEPRFGSGPVPVRRGRGLRLGEKEARDEVLLALVSSAR